MRTWTRIARRPPDLDALNDFYDTVGFGRLLRNQAERIADSRLSFGLNRRGLRDWLRAQPR